MAEPQDNPVARAIREKLRDLDVQAKLRKVIDDAEAAGVIDAKTADRRRARLEAALRDLEQNP